LIYPLFSLAIAFLFFIYSKIFFKINLSLSKALDNTNHVLHLKKILFWWIVPPITFFIFFHYSKGYILLCSAAITASIALLFLEEKIKTKTYILLIIIQSAFFLTVNYKLPNVQTYFISSKRNIDVTEVLSERLESNYLLSKSNINSMQAEFKTIDEIIEDIQNDSSGLYSSKKYLLIDPTINISPRALQAEYPKITFTKISPQNSSIFGKFHNLDLISDKPLSKMLSKAIIFSRKDFVDNYLQNINITRKDYDYWSLYIPDKNDIKLLENLYMNYFDRSQLN
jgi:hypothetical protein